MMERFKVNALSSADHSTVLKEWENAKDGDMLLTVLRLRPGSELRKISLVSDTDLIVLARFSKKHQKTMQGMSWRLH